MADEQTQVPLTEAVVVIRFPCQRCAGTGKDKRKKCQPCDGDGRLEGEVALHELARLLTVAARAGGVAEADVQHVRPPPNIGPPPSASDA